MNKTTIVHTGLAVATAGGVSDAMVTVLVWLLSLAHVAVPDNVSTAFGVLFTAGIGFAIHHFMNKPAANDNEAPAVEPAAEAASVKTAA